MRAPTPASRRQQRLRRTAWVLALVFLAGFGFLAARTWWTRPAGYRPDEQPEGITRDLARELPPGAPQPRLTDVTDAAGVSRFRAFAGTRTSQLPEDMGSGLAWGDFDNDGDDDLFVVGAGGAMPLPDKDLPACVLFENLGNGRFREVPGFPETRIRGLGVAWADYDGDGWLDLTVAGYNALRLFHNEGGSGRFLPDPRLPDLAGFWAGVAWGDYDRDRRLDLYVCQYVEYAVTEADRGRTSDQVGTAVPFTLNPAAFPGGRNALFHQMPDGSFTNVAAALGVENQAGRSLGAVWHDFDQDGWPDLYVANDVSDNVYFQNMSGRFEDRSHAAWVADYRSAMGLAVGDPDRDGDDDLFITHWVAQENALYENLWADLNGVSARARPGGTGTEAPDRGPDVAAGTPRTRVPVKFMDIADQKGLGQVALPRVGWGTEFVDLDQDGWLDLVVVNGSTLESEGPSPRRLEPQSAFLFWNDQGRHFHDLAPLLPAFAEPRVGRGFGTADWDGDGDLDLALTDLAEGVRLFRNDMATGHWLKIRLRSRTASGQAVGFGDGATVVVWVGDIPLRRSVTAGSYLSQGSHVLHWGLGTASRVDRLEVHWPGGQVQRLEGVDGDSFYELPEDGALRRLAGAASPGGAGVPSGGAGTRALDRSQQLVFWQRHRAGMDALKVERNPGRAAGFFREAIALDPRHEDARYYLALCLVALADPEAALVELEALQRLNPASHRAWQQWGSIRAIHSRGSADLEAAERALERARAINPEETGVLLLLGEIALLRGDGARAGALLGAVHGTNPRSVGALFLRGYLAWRGGDATAASVLLHQARQALGPDWKPEGSTAEGDVRNRQHVETSPLTRYWAGWDGREDPGLAFRALGEALGRGPEGGVPTTSTHSPQR